LVLLRGFRYVRPAEQTGKITFENCTIASNAMGVPGSVPGCSYVADDFDNHRLVEQDPAGTERVGEQGVESDCVATRAGEPVDAR
jgi:hypothetical protein